jgi:hypothetical protein
MESATGTGMAVGIPIYKRRATPRKNEETTVSTVSTASDTATPQQIRILRSMPLLTVLPVLTIPRSDGCNRQHRPSAR